MPNWRICCEFCDKRTINKSGYCDDCIEKGYNIPIDENKVRNLTEVLHIYHQLVLQEQVESKPKIRRLWL